MPEDRERLLRMILFEAFKRSNDVMFYSDKSGVILDVNDAFIRHYGYSRAEVIGQTPRILRSKHSTNDLYKRMWSSILDPKKGYWRGEIINRTKDGREIPLILTITAVRDAGGETVGYMSNAIDISEQLALQNRVADSEALAALGEMAAVVAHEIRNPLTSIVMAANQLAGDMLDKSDREMVTNVLKTESKRLSDTLSNFLAYARPRHMNLAPVDLNKLIQSVCGVVASNVELMKKVKLVMKPDPGLKPVSIDADQVRQVLWNILLNGIQAMEGEGTLTVATGHNVQGAFFSISDTGAGIAEQNLRDIFKPFHTTKKQGTGLGLAIADRIVKAHGGRIEVRTRLGHGTTFAVVFPSAEN